MKKLFLMLFVLALCAVPAWADGPHLIVAGSGDNVVVAYDLSNGGLVGSQKFGTQAIAVGAMGGRAAIADFLGGKVIVVGAQPVGDYLGVSRTALTTAPDLLNPEGITMTGIGGWALVTDGVSTTGTVALTLVDIFEKKVVSKLPLPSAYGVAFDRITWVAYVLDGLNSQVIPVKLMASGEMVDLGIRIPLTGPVTTGRFIALDAAHQRLLVSFKLEGSVEAIDIPTQTSLGKVLGLGGAIGAIAITPDGAKAFVADYATSNWAVLDLAAPGLPVDTGTRITCGHGAPNTFAGVKTFAFHNDLMYFSCTDANHVDALNWRTFEVVHTDWPTGLTPAGMDILY